MTTSSTELMPDAHRVAVAGRALDLLQLQYFLEMARVLSVTVAARNLRITQSSLTRQISALETALGVELFHRQPKGMTLTQAGVVAIQEFADFLEQYDQAHIAIATPKTANQQSFRLSVPWWVSIENIAALETSIAMSGMYSGLELHIMPSTHAAEALRKGDLDAAVVAMPIDDQALNCRAVGHIDLVALVPSEHPLAMRDSIRLCELAVLPSFVMFGRQTNPGQYYWLRERHAAQGFNPKRLTFVDDPASMIQQVAAGQSAATFNAVAPKILRFDGVTAVPLNPRDALRTSVAVATRLHSRQALPPNFIPAIRHMLVPHRETLRPPELHSV